MVSFGAGIVDGIRRGYCAYFRQIQNYDAWFERVTSLGAPGPIQDLSDALYRWQCGTEDDPPQLPPPPFSGGQCPIDYQVTGTLQLNLASTGEPFSTSTVTSTAAGFSSLRGPITGTYLGASDGGVITAEGPRQFFVYDPANFTVGSWSITSVTPSNPAISDECGDPPVVLPPPTNIEINIDIDYDGGSVTNIPVTIGPFFVAVGGAIYAPIEINLPDVNLTGNLNLTPEFSFSPEFNLNIGGVETTPDGEPPPSNPSGPGEEEPEEPEEPPTGDRRIIAVTCSGRIEDDARATGIYQEIGPDIYAPRLASVRFGTVINGVLFWSNDVPVKGLRSVIECPIPWGATEVVLNAEPGVAMNYSPVRALPPEYPPFLEFGSSRLSENR